MKLPTYLKELLGSPPQAGEGVNNWLFKVSFHLHRYWPAPKIMAELGERTRGCGRVVTHSEIERQVTSSLIQCCCQPVDEIGRVRSSSLTQGCQPRGSWPTVNQELRSKVILDNGGLDELKNLSNPRLDPEKRHTEEIVTALFPGNPLLCCALSKSRFNTRTRDEWRGQLEPLQLIVPSPMSAKQGRTKDGAKESEHTLENTGPRRFLVVEFDTGTTDEHASILIHLAGFAPLVCAVHSGGKSLHGWFHVEGLPEDRVLKFFRYAVQLGADRALWTRSQFVRMPDGTRDNGRIQKVVFVNFNLREVK